MFSAVRSTKSVTDFFLKGGGPYESSTWKCLVEDDPFNSAFDFRIGRRILIPTVFLNSRPKTLVLLRVSKVVRSSTITFHSKQMLLGNFDQPPP